MRHYFPRPTNLFILIFFLIANVNANEQVQDQSMSSEEEAIPEKRESQDNTTALIYHWLELARLYEQDCNEEMASMAYTQAQNLQNPSIIISLEELLSSALFSYFLGWTQRDPQQILDVTAPLFLLPLYSNGLVKHEQRAFFSEFFATYPQLNQLSIEDFYDLNTMDIVQLDASKSIVSLRAHPMPPASIQEWRYWSNFWNNTHHYFFQKMADNKWYLLAFDMDEVGTDDLFFPGEKS
ncbi:hypothetical protein PVA44_00015 [Entomospira nematocerorum]|uniref:Uncharacterized protein n=1 Tax=Entomospira nematocerorum TaxID=2719987 RepID=A0A968GDP0_9SPIO|nr:hypothetical protein [Entomospira nematocera]NIZ47573.1 hypothetical protein [Entomospira nematocera]WDI33888.1 hypothetical protein PVA44_00015 [Entomospira nematocera]